VFDALIGTLVFAGPSRRSLAAARPPPRGVPRARAASESPSHWILTTRTLAGLDAEDVHAAMAEHRQSDPGATPVGWTSCPPAGQHLETDPAKVTPDTTGYQCRKNAPARIAESGANSCPTSCRWQSCRSASSGSVLRPLPRGGRPAPRGHRRAPSRDLSSQRAPRHDRSRRPGRPGALRPERAHDPVVAHSRGLPRPASAGQGTCRPAGNPTWRRPWPPEAQPNPSSSRHWLSPRGAVHLQAIRAILAGENAATVAARYTPDSYRAQRGRPDHVIGRAGGMVFPGSPSSV
jgi:hypothetical protein